MEPPSLADGLDRSPISSFILSPLSSLSIVNNNIFVEFNFLNNSSLEAQIASLSDDIAYNSHDLEDGLNANLFNINDYNNDLKYSENDVKSSALNYTYKYNNSLYNYICNNNKTISCPKIFHCYFDNNNQKKSRGRTNLQSFFQASAPLCLRVILIIREILKTSRNNHFRFTCFSMLLLFFH